jgi:hypothetical protein
MVPFTLGAEGRGISDGCWSGSTLKSLRMRTNLLLLICFFATGVCNAVTPSWISFGNFSTNEIYVTDILIDGKDTGIPCGILVPGGAKSTSDMFPKRVPNTFTIIFKQGSLSITQNVSGKTVADLIKAAGTSDEITVHFVYSHKGIFIPKVEASEKRTPSEVGKLFPEENDPLFQKYKTLIRAAYDGDVAGVKAAIKNGAPFTWPDDPVGLTPLEWTIRWNREPAFDALMATLPPDYSAFNYAHCLRLAIQSGNSGLLNKLLAQPLADQVPQRELQEIFYTACYSTKSPSSLGILLNHYPVGIDYRVRDYGHTLLFVAVQGQNDDVVEWLVNHGANKNVTLQNGSKPIEHARDERVRKLLSQP